MFHLYEFEVFMDEGWYLALPYDWQGGTQGKTFEEACEMAADWLRVMCEDCAMHDKEFTKPTFGNDPRNGGRVVLIGIEAGRATVSKVTAG